MQKMNMETILDIIKTALQVIACFLMPYVVWLHSSVTKHAQKIMLLEQKLGDLEKTTSDIESKLDKINETSIRSATKIDSIEKATQEIKEFLKSIRR